MHIAAGLPVNARDATGAGDSLAAAVMYGYLNGLDLEQLGDLANADRRGQGAQAGHRPQPAHRG